MRVSAYGQQQYEAASRLAFAVAPVAAQARITTKSFGFRFAWFGLTYTSERVDLDPNNLAKASAEFRGKEYQRLLESFRDVEAVREQLSGGSEPAQPTAPESRGEASQTGLKRGLSAYARAILAADPPPCMLTAVV